MINLENFTNFPEVSFIDFTLINLGLIEFFDNWEIFNERKNVFLLKKNTFILKRSDWIVQINKVCQAQLNFCAVP